MQNFTYIQIFHPVDNNPNSKRGETSKLLTMDILVQVRQCKKITFLCNMSYNHLTVWLIQNMAFAPFVKMEGNVYNKVQLH